MTELERLPRQWRGVSQNAVSELVSRLRKRLEELEREGKSKDIQLKTLEIQNKELKERAEGLQTEKGALATEVERLSKSVSEEANRMLAEAKEKAVAVRESVEKLLERAILEVNEIMHCKRQFHDRLKELLNDYGSLLSRLALSDVQVHPMDELVQQLKSPLLKEFSVGSQATRVEKSHGATLPV